MNLPIEKPPSAEPYEASPRWDGAGYNVSRARVNLFKAAMMCVLVFALFLAWAFYYELHAFIYARSPEFISGMLFGMGFFWFFFLIANYFDKKEFR